MISYDYSLNQHILEDYIRKEKMRWHPINDCPFFDPTAQYSLTNKDRNNNNTVYFIGLELSKIDDDLDNKKWAEDYRIIKCRYFVIDNRTFDMLNPTDIIALPVPKINFNITSVSIGVINEYLAAHPDIKEKLEAEKDIELSPQAIETIIRRAELLLGRSFTDKEHEELVEWFAFEDENISDEKLIDEVRFFEHLGESANDIPEDQMGTDSSEDDDSDDDIFEDDLGEVIIKLANNTNDQVLNIPLTHIAINHAIAMRLTQGVFKNLIIQTIAVGNVDYGKWLIRQMEDAFPDWNEEELINASLNRRAYIKSELDYQWVCDNLPDIAPKTKAAFTRAQNDNTSKYQSIVNEAAKLGYSLPVHEPKSHTLSDFEHIDDTKVKADSSNHFIPYFDRHPKLSPSEEHAYGNLLDFYREDFERHRNIVARINVLDAILKKLKWTDSKRLDTLYELAMDDIKNYYPKWVAFYDEVIKFYPEQEKNIRHDAFESTLVGYFVHKTAAISLEKAQQYEKLINLCEACLNVGLTEDGTKGGMRARYDKAKKRV